LNAGVMSRRPAARAARLDKATSLAGATQHDLRTFWTSCRLRLLVQSIPSCDRHGGRAATIAQFVQRLPPVFGNCGGAHFLNFQRTRPPHSRPACVAYFFS